VAWPGAAAEEYDLVIRGGRVMDPASGLDRVAWVGVKRGKVAAISGNTLRGREILGAERRVVAPGFVDILSGSSAVGDRYKVTDGVTTVIATHGGPVEIAAYYETTARRQPLLNYGTVVGHGSLRQAAGVTNGDLPATPEQVAAMARRAEQSLREGALGVGFGIEYIPGTSGEEVTALAEVAARYGGTVHAHIRLPHVFDPFQGINELIAASAATGARVQVVHIGSMTIHRMTEALRLIDLARKRGIDIAADVYPYDAWMTGIQSAIFAPGWREKYALDYGDLVWPATGERLTAESFERYRRQGGSVVCHQIAERDIATALRHPAVSVASDGTINDGPANHPRGAGTFSRVLSKYVREEKVLSLMSALRKMTVMPAERMAQAAPAMRGKGRVQIGADADLVVFDPATVRDRATFQDPKQTSTGIDHVLVNGVPVVRDGALVPAPGPGRPIRGTGRPRATAVRR
jgi:dihydroorotase